MWAEFHFWVPMNFFNLEAQNLGRRLIEEKNFFLSQSRILLQERIKKSLRISKNNFGSKIFQVFILGLQMNYINTRSNCIFSFGIYYAFEHYIIRIYREKLKISIVLCNTGIWTLLWSQTYLIQHNPRVAVVHIFTSCAQKKLTLNLPNRIIFLFVRNVGPIFFYPSTNPLISLFCFIFRYRCCWFLILSCFNDFLFLRMLGLRFEIYNFPGSQLISFTSF